MQKKKRRRIWIWVGIGAGAVLVAIVLCNVLKGRSKTPEVQALKLSPTSITSTVSAEGGLRAANQVNISAEIVAQVSKIYVKEGDQVRKGQLLCQLEGATLLSSTDLARANLEEAAAAYKRGQALYADSLSSAADFERLRTAYEVAKAQFDQSQEQLGKTRIYSPISGRVVRVEVEEGETVVMGTMNNPGTVLFTIADLSSMQDSLAVDETEVVGIMIGQDAKVTIDALPDTFFRARVRSVGYMASTNASTIAAGVTEFEVILDMMDIDSTLRPGMTVSADIITASRENVLVCPLRAVGKETRDGKNLETVFVLKGDKAKWVYIKTGISDGINVEVTEGLKEGDVVITGPYSVLRTLKDGDAVKLQTKGEESWREKGRPSMPRPGSGEAPGGRPQQGPAPSGR